MLTIPLICGGLRSKIVGSDLTCENVKFFLLIKEKDEGELKESTV